MRQIMKKTYEINPAWIRPSQSELVNKAVVLIGLVATLTIFGVVGYFSDKRDVERYADTNKDGIVSTNEWGTVYDELRLPYNLTNRVQLNSKQVGEYLDNHDSVRIERNKAEAAHRMLMGHSVQGFR